MIRSTCPPSSGASSSQLSLSSLLVLSMAEEVDTTDSLDDFTTINSAPLFLVALVALAIGVAAQSFINQMLEGDRGLGAFLKDGSGYNKSGFRSSSSSSRRSRSGEEETATKKKDPLPWLKLPKLDFVEVAGQQDDTLAFAKLEELRVQMKEQLDLGNVKAASRLKEQLEDAMEATGIEYYKAAEMDE